MNTGNNGARLRCVAFKPLCHGALRGFASIAFYLGDAPGPKFVLHSVAIHAHKNGAAWASPPAQAVIRDGQLVRDDRGKVQYGGPLLEFASKDERRRWSDSVIRAVLRFDPSALDCREDAA
jgi:hypothetical protein